MSKYSIKQTQYEHRLTPEEFRLLSARGTVTIRRPDVVEKLPYDVLIEVNNPQQTEKLRAWSYPDRRDKSALLVKYTGKR